MSFEKTYLSSLFEENKNPTPTGNCSAIRNSLAILYNESLKTLSNTSSNLILEQKLSEYSEIVGDNRDESCVDNYAGPIESLRKGKIQTRHCSSWTSQLSSFENSLAVLKNALISSGHCNASKNLACNGDELTSNDIKMLFKNGKEAGLLNVAAPSTSDSFSVNKDFTQNEMSFEPKINKVNTFKTNLPVQPSTSNYFNGNASSSKFSNQLTNQSIPLRGIHNKIFNRNTSSDMESRNHYSTSRNNVPEKKIAQEPPNKPESFRTARSELLIQNKKKFGDSKQNYHQIPEPMPKRSLGTTRSILSKFIPPIAFNNDEHEQHREEDIIQDEKLKHIDPKMVELIMSEIIDSSAPIDWDDIAGLDFAKATIQEAVVWPLLRPDIFTGLRRPPKGMLLFGPPGTGKTLIGKCIASKCSATFFSISASSLTSKWIGDGEKMVRALFAVARCHQPAVVFIDEIDSLLTQRSDAEHEATRRIKTEFLVQLDGAATGDEDQLLVIGATNRPQELDEAARRRLVKRLYIPLPDVKARQQIIDRLMRTERHSLTGEDSQEIASLADGFSGADMKSLCSEAALCPIRAIPFSQMTKIQTDQVRPVNVEDFKKALSRVRPSVSGNDLEQYTKWDKTYGSGNNPY